jgi:hypothetical protein
LGKSWNLKSEDGKPQRNPVPHTKRRQSYVSHDNFRITVGLKSYRRWRMKKPANASALRVLHVWLRDTI